MKQTTYKPRMPYEIHAAADGGTNLKLVAFADGKPVAGPEALTNEQLVKLLQVAITVQDLLTKEYFRRNPEKERDCDEFVKKQAEAL